MKNKNTNRDSREVKYQNERKQNTKNIIKQWSEESDQIRRDEKPPLWL